MTSNSSNGTVEDSTPLQARIRPGSAMGFIGGGGVKGREVDGSEDGGGGMGERRMSEDKEKDARVQRKVRSEFLRMEREVEKD